MSSRRSIAGPRAGEIVEIDRELIIGREGDVAIEDPEVSRRHAAVRPVPAGVELEDLGSSNGTFVDGRRIVGKTTLTKSASVRVGASELRIEIALPEATRVRPVAAQPPEATRVRPVQTERPEATDRPGEPTPAPTSRRHRAPLIGGVLGVLVIAAVAVILLVGGGSSTTTTARANPYCDKHFPGWIKDGFPEPPTIVSHDGVLNATLTATLHTIHVDHHTYEGMEYDGSSPGPTLVMCRGDVVHVNLVNKLPLPTNLHVHGLHVSPAGHSDNIFVDINPLQNFHYTYAIPLDQSPGTDWYHPHYHPLVDAETTAGMLGGIIVEGGLDEELRNIPQRLIMIHGGKPTPINGKTLPIPGTKPGQIKPPPSPGPPELLVNGVYQPTLHIRPGELQRWRIANATGERFVKLALPGVTFQVLAYDGQTLEYMRPEREILIGPGERVDVLVRGGPAGRNTVDSMPFQPCFKGCFDPFGGIPETGRNYGFQALINVISSGSAVDQPLPTGALAHPLDLRHAHVDVYRTIVMARVPSLVHLPQFPLNGKLFDPNRIDITMALNSVEQWTIKSPDTATSDEWHNFHIHTNPFQVIAIDGRPLNYVDWQDTVNIPAGGSVTVLMHPIDFTGKSVFHCHVSFHEDNGMMGVFQIVKDPPASEVNADRVLYMNPPSNKAVIASALVNANLPHQLGLASLLFWCDGDLVSS
jgi:FtsP/CotA-like multicopper oxidase with cupredoxin domain